MHRIEQVNLNTLMKPKPYKSDRTINSISNSLIDDNGYNVKKKWMYDSKEFSGVGKSILGISEQNHYDGTPYKNSNYMGDTQFSQSSMRHMSSNPDVLVERDYGVVPKELIEKIEQASDAKSIMNDSTSENFQVGYNINNGFSLPPASVSEQSYSKANNQKIAKYLIKKLANTNVRVRKLVMQAFLIIMNHCKQTAYLNMLLPYLGSTSWHVREEILHLIMISFL